MIEADALSRTGLKADTTAGLRNTVLASLIVFAVVLRLTVRLVSPHLIYADEIFQSIEQAHRLVFGTGQVPWEFQVGIRSWLIPGILAPFMWLGHLLGPAPDTLLLPTKVFLAVASTTPVICGFLWGERFGGLMGAIVTGALSAIWVDNIYFSTHALSEVFAADTLVVALYLGYPGTSSPSPKRLFYSGLIFGLTFALRFHLAPAIFVALIWIWRTNHKQCYLPLLSGFLLPVCLSGLLDWLTWNYPFQSIWLNIWLNVVKGISGDYGLSPQWFFFIAPIFFWGGACALVALTAFAGSFRLPLLLVVPAVLMATMTVFQHKEYRFIYPAIPLIIILSGLGTSEGLRLIWERFGNRVARRFTLGALAVCFWSMTCFAIGMSPAVQPQLTAGSATISAFHAVSTNSEICAVGLYKYESLTLGISGLPANIGLDEVDDAHLSKEAAGFNAIITEARYSVPDARFHKQACWADRDDVTVKPIGTACLWVRSGTCKPEVATPSRLEWPKSWRDSVVPNAILERLHQNPSSTSDLGSGRSSQK